MTSTEPQGLTQVVPVNFTIGLPTEDISSVLGPVTLRGGGYLPFNDSSSDVAVGGSMADQYGIKTGSNMQVNGLDLNVSAVFDTKMALLDRCIIMPLAMAQNIYNYPQSVNLIAVKPTPNVSEQNLSATIKYNISYVNALTGTERNDIVEPVLDQVTNWTTGIEVVVFIISLILVMIVMIMSVSERRRDFATLDALGAPANYVFRVVIVEAFLVGVLGGVVGVAFGSLGAVALASFYTGIPINTFFPSFLSIVPPFFVLEMFAAIVAVCCLGAVIPALNAMRMRMAEVLKAEY
jgi:putative ABC transport system permease protein